MIKNTLNDNFKKVFKRYDIIEKRLIGKKKGYIFSTNINIQLKKY